jgi:membrane fusion protein (multidrug efflux system)
VAWLLGGLLLSAWLYWFGFASVTVYEISNKARLQVNRSAHPITALVSGKIIKASMSLGQEVHEGEVLIELNSGNEKLRLQEEESRMKALPPQITAIEKQITALAYAQTKGQQAALAAVQTARSRQQEARSALAFANDKLQRINQAGQAVPQIENMLARTEAQKLSSVQAALASEIQRLEMDAQTRHHQEQAEIEKLKGEVAKLRGELDTSAKTIARLQQDISQHLIRSPANGNIGDIGASQVGTYIAIGDQLGTVVPQSELNIVAFFPPAAVLGRIHPGQASRMRLDGFPWTQFGTLSAKVSHVGSEIRNNQVQVEFTPKLDDGTRILPQHGLPGTIEVSIEQISPALMLLRSAGQLFTHHKAALPTANNVTP